MNRIFLGVIIFFIFFSCIKDTSPLIPVPSEISSGSDAGISDSIRLLYKSDAAYLAFRYIYAEKMADTQRVYIPQYLIDSFYGGLIHIYNCKTITSIDTITKMYPVHAFPQISLYRLVVGIDTSYAWTKQWQQGYAITGNDSIDSLIEQYELGLAPVHSHFFIVLYSKIPLNMWTLGVIFKQIAGVQYAEPDGAGGSGNDIRASLNSEQKNYTFTIGWGDCRAGCIQRRFWEYTVSSDGTVYYLGSYGDHFDQKSYEIW